MISRASPFFLYATVGLLIVVAVTLITPIHSSDGGVRAFKFWWSRFAPLSYARHAMESADIFILYHDDRCPDLTDPVQAWRTISADREAAAIFGELFDSPRGVTRLYGLAGLFVHDSVAFGVALRSAVSDTAQVISINWTRLTLDTSALAAKAVPDTVEFWADRLSGGGLPNHQCAV